MRNTNTILSFVIIILLVVVLYDDLGSFEFTRPETSVGAVTFQEAEKTYKDLRSQWFDGKLSDTDFEERINQLKVKDVHGRSWQLGVRTGEWYFNDGQKWVKVSLSAAIQSLASSALIIVMVVLFLIRNIV